MIKSTHAILVILFSMLAISACDTLQELGVAKKPSVLISGFSIRSFSLEGIIIDATLDVNNTNPVPITLSGYDYKLAINGNQLLAGKQFDKTEVAAYKVSKVTIPLELEFSDLKALGSNLLNQDEVKYDLSTTVFLDLPVLGRIPFPVTKSGMLPVPMVPAITVSGFNLNHIGLTGADLTIGVKLNNDNAFGIDLSRMTGALAVNGATWINSSITDGLKVEPKQAQVVKIPLKLNFLSAGKNIMNLLQGEGAINYQLSGEAVMGASLPMMKSFSFPFNVSGNMEKH